MFGALLFCSVIAQAQDVRYNFVPGTNFAQYKTYKWIDIPGGAHPNQIVDGQIKQAVDSQLAMKGLTKSNDDNADLYVGYQIAVDQEKQWNAFGGGLGWRLGGGMASATSSTINIGSLVLDIYDSKAKQLVWTGTATHTIDPSKNPEKNMEHIQKGMAKLLKNFPPPPGK
jgi:hypothetical protein